MKIEILGTGCAKCHKLEEMVKKVLHDSKTDAEVNKIQDIKKIMSYGVMMTPALVIDNDVKIAGKMPTEEQIKSWLIGS
ncbi:MAG TPA: thioredoxin family protein [Smithellaceae bacterium]|nr:thioredoxin family protein [Smithellaceae bacterium]